MKAEELKILDKLRVLGGKYGKLKQSCDEYCRYDAICMDNFLIVEIKKRHTYYEKTMIELDKYSFNTTFAEIHKFVFLYVVEMENSIYIFNITELKNMNYNFEWSRKPMPKQTEFNNNNEIAKWVGYINIADSAQIINYVKE